MSDAMKTIFAIEGMHCGACVKKLQAALSEAGMQAQVSLVPPQAAIESAMPIAFKKVQEVVSRAGAYSAKVSITSERNTLASNIIPNAVSMEMRIESASQNWLETYRPLLLIFAYIAGVTLLIELTHFAFNGMRAMSHFMAGFFLVFSFFKLLNLRAFAEAYAGYDLLAMHWRGYGFVYPFIELALGVAYVLKLAPFTTNAITFAVMGFSALGVIKALADKKTLACACLGAVFNLPMSTVTLVEDLLMVLMAGAMMAMS
jgi:copper chaperone CopZ